MPWTTTQKTITGMIILISLMKPAPGGVSLTGLSGQSRPMTAPRTRARTTWPKSERKKRGMGDSRMDGDASNVDDKLVYNNVVNETDLALGTNPRLLEPPAQP